RRFRPVAFRQDEWWLRVRGDLPEHYPALAELLIPLPTRRRLAVRRKMKRPPHLFQGAVFLPRLAVPEPDGRGPRGGGRIVLEKQPPAVRGEAVIHPLSRKANPEGGTLLSGHYIPNLHASLAHVGSQEPAVRRQLWGLGSAFAGDRDNQDSF